MKSNGLDWFGRRVKAQMILTGTRYEDLLGASEKSWRDRMKDPGRMKLRDLVYLLNRLGFSREEKQYIVSLLIEDEEKGG